jgi:hypothetical protein
MQTVVFSLETQIKYCFLKLKSRLGSGIVFWKDVLRPDR